jgi:hypothetical protein
MQPACGPDLHFEEPLHHLRDLALRLLHLLIALALDCAQLVLELRAPRPQGRHLLDGGLPTQLGEAQAPLDVVDLCICLGLQRHEAQLVLLLRLLQGTLER